MSIDWFRSWHGAPTDTKWLLIAKKAGVPAGIVSAVVWALFDHASQCEQRGNIEGFDVETYAIFSGFEEAQIAAVITALKEKNIIENGCLSAWSKRQPKREDNSSERVAKHRVTQCNAVKRDVTQCNSREEKIREEEDKKKDGDADRVAPVTVDDPQKRYFRRVKEICGERHGGALAKKLLEAKGGVVSLASSAVEAAAGKENPRQYIGAIISKGGSDPPNARPDLSW